MGIDVLLYAVVSEKPEDLKELGERFFKHAPPSMTNEYRLEEGVFRYEDETMAIADPWVSNERHWPRVELNTLQRYADKGKIWPWPDIYQAICVMQALFPGAAIHYGGDTAHTAPPITEERSEDLWDIWYEARQNKEV